MRQKFCYCSRCGNVIALLRDQGGQVSCCGAPMEELEPEEGEGSGEKHIPVCQVEGNHVTVLVGGEAHPMTPEHRIEWVCIETTNGAQYRSLARADVPGARFALVYGEKVERALALCSLHGLWASEQIRIQ